MNETRTFFQYAVLFFFGILGVTGIIFFALTRSTTSSTAVGSVVIWGPAFPSGEGFQKMVDEFSTKGASLEGVRYETKNADTLYSALTEALASGSGPDLVILDASSLLALRDKIIPITYKTYPLSQYQKNFIDGANVFTTSSDVLYALPIAVDPLVLFWNKDLFANAGLAQVPADWETFVRTVPLLTNIQNSSDVIQSAIAFGEYNNVLHAKEILSALFMQAGVSIVMKDSTGALVSDLDKNDTTKNAELAVRFFTDFSNPVKTVYAWNKTFNRSREAFAENKVAMYGGFASELAVLPEINPNLNFGMALWPQSSAGTTKLTYGTIYGVAILKGSKNPQRALAVAEALSTKELAPSVQKAMGIPSTRRDSLVIQPNDPFSEVLMHSAVFSRAWLQPGVGGSVADVIFSRLINSVVSGTQTPASALNIATKDLTVSLSAYKQGN